MRVTYGSQEYQDFLRNSKLPLGDGTDGIDFSTGLSAITFILLHPSLFTLLLNPSLKIIVIVIRPHSEHHCSMLDARY